MFHIIQSNSTDRLVNHLIDFYKKNNEQTDLARLIFTPFTVIVPSMVLGDWLIKTVANRVGISTLFAAEFWGKYQWEMMQTVLNLDAKRHPDDALSVPEVAVLSASIMRWRIFGFVASEFGRHSEQILNDDTHPLHFLIKPLYDDDTQSLPEQRLWHSSDELSRLYVRYLTHRPEWLAAWADGVSLADTLTQMMDEKDRLDGVFGVVEPDDGTNEQDDDTDSHGRTESDSQEGGMPEWLRQHYLDVERLLGYLWFGLFGEAYRYRLALEDRFWQVLSTERDDKSCQDEADRLSQQAIHALPKALYLFTVQQIPKAEIDFLKRLSLYLDVILLHFNPSMMFWADIVDRQWLKTQQIIRSHMVYLKDYGHGLLSRLGKESRDTFAMLADLSGGESHEGWQVRWQDDFDEMTDTSHQTSPNLLQGLKSDILMLNHDTTMSRQAGGQILSALLDEAANDAWPDDESLTQKSRPKTPLTIEQHMEMGSLSIHACHGLKRQLELSRLMIAKYLNDHPERSLADVVVLLPDIMSSKDVIRSVFPDGRGADGLYLPIKITGVPDQSIDELIGAIMGFYELLGEPTSRFYADDVYEWLLIPALYESFGLSFDEMKRGIDLLRQAGFRRGFDERHLAQTLHAKDEDYRYTFSHALDRLVLGLLAPAKIPSEVLHPFTWRASTFAEASLPLMGVSLSDEPIINALTAIHAGLDKNRHLWSSVGSVERLLNRIEHEVINPYFSQLHDSVAMRAIFNSKNAMMSSLRANKYYHRQLTKAYHNPSAIIEGDDIVLSMKFVCQSLSQMVKAQAISAEPSEVITFARFGTLRSIPFGLTVMVDMNLSAFPRQDRAMRLDLMRAGVRRLGDRHNEDDDNGAFLDALLCTRDVCLIFYQGLSADGRTKLLPASVVSELIEFFKTEAQWSQDNIDDSWQAEQEDAGIAALVTKLMPALIEEYLVTYHGASFFDRSLYYQEIHSQGNSDDLTEQLRAHLQSRLASLKQRQQQALPPPPLWQHIRQVLDCPIDAPKVTPWLTDSKVAHLAHLAHLLEQSFDCHDDTSLSHHVHTVCSLYGLTLPTKMSGDEIIHQYKNFAKIYLEDKVKIDKTPSPTEQNEPLSLDGLGRYQMSELFIRGANFGLFHEVQDNQKILADVLCDAQHHIKTHADREVIHAIQALYYGDLLPAGQLRLSTPDEYFVYAKDKFGEFVRALHELRQEDFYAKFLSEDDRLTPITEQNITLHSDDIYMTITARIPSEGSVWLNILPNAARAEHLFGFFVKHVIWQAANEETVFSLWQFDKSGDLKFKHHLFAITGMSRPVAKAYLMNLILLLGIARQQPIIMTHRDGMNYIYTEENERAKLSRKLFDDWIGVEGRAIYENDSRHKVWQMILQGADPYQALVGHLPLAMPLYRLMKQHLRGI